MAAAISITLAVLAHRLLTGEVPYAGTPLGVMFRASYQGLERDAIRDLPPAAQQVFQRSLAKTPAERYATCTQMVEALDSALIRRPVAATRVADASEFAAIQAPSPVAAPSGSPSRHFSGEALKYFGITFVVCALILGAVFYFLLRPKTPHATQTVVPGLTPPPSATQPVVTPPAPAAAVPSAPVEKTPAPAAKSKAAKRGGREANRKCSSNQWNRRSSGRSHRRGQLE